MRRSGCTLMPEPGDPHHSERGYSEAIRNATPAVHRKALQQARMAAGELISEAAGHLGWDIHVMMNIERGLIDPTPDQAAQLLGRYGWSESDGAS